MKDIYFIRKTFQGAWQIWGNIGVRQYFYYTKKQAIEDYKKEIITNMNPKKDKDGKSKNDI